MFPFHHTSLKPQGNVHLSFSINLNILNILIHQSLNTMHSVLFHQPRKASTLRLPEVNSIDHLPVPVFGLQ